ncbi:MAG TPA: putative metalloprotease CJM1_0395 family protein [Phycisphaerae bacterium]|nr:putative metalloprotease CJM1_0395 family protein [Phycisphaerae bacterium]
MSIGACESCDSVNRLLSAAGSGLIRHSAALSRPGEAQKPGAIRDEPVGKSELSDDELEQVRKLEERDTEVRRHEQAHAAAAGPHARGGPKFEFETGPDGRQYAVGGEVSIDTSKAESPEATIAKAQQIRRAANAPAEPSSQDRAVAAKATQLEQQARRELREAQQAESANPTSNADSDDGAGLSPANTTRARIASIYADAAAPPPAFNPGSFINVAV